MGKKILRYHSPKEFFIALAVGLLLKSTLVCVMCWACWCFSDKNISLINPITFHYDSRYYILLNHFKLMLQCQNPVLYIAQSFLYARLKNGRIMLWQCPSVCPSVRPSVRVFRTFFQRALRYQFETWYMHSVGGTTCRVWVSSQLGHFDLVYSQK